MRRTAMQIPSLLLWLDYFGVVVFATSGAIVAAHKRLDPVGLMLAATVTGIGGGTLRDLLLDRPVFWLAAWQYVALTAGTALFLYALGWFAPRFSRWLTANRALDWLDAIGLSVFCLIGAQAALDAGANGFIAVIMGVMTASFGGLIRDIICNEIPMILHREIYATAAAAGAAAFVLTEGWLTHEMALMIGAAVAFSLRAMGIVRGWHLPAYPTLPE
jgi:uncharacterized membrane protein YeiH